MKSFVFQSWAVDRATITASEESTGSSPFMVGSSEDHTTSNGSLARSSTLCLPPTVVWKTPDTIQRASAFQLA